MQDTAREASLNVSKWHSLHLDMPVLTDQQELTTGLCRHEK